LTMLRWHIAIIVRHREQGAVASEEKYDDS